ncbi:CPBP family intramembrane glutamic endopeptidase [Methylobacter sp.]|uniref:CPBP family intramembrane glutamic endopeptidase n=1 Tax=Methylobacter sp. TaxID=2051955 RepID=UPI0011FB6EDA|nr:CPBP family intramembrane glutamic endopeptidase [Methylobacter sp.]TAK60803.1 MAG: CPBP family intramembrane metalloprotease [Methylobacter sp.]
MLRYIVYSIVPLLVLLATASLACIVGYLVLQNVETDFSLSKIITKSTQLFLVLSIFPAMAYLKFNKADLGFAARPLFLKQLLLGFGLGLITLMPVFIVQYALGINVIDEAHTWTAGLVAKKMLIALSVGLLVSMIEEPIFRGILFAGLKKKLPVTAAILFSSAYYAALHFLDSQTEIPAQQVQVLSGFTLLGEAFANLLNPEILSAFLALLMVGIFLGILRAQVKESLGLCIGCHTCWVWQIKMSKSVFNTDFSSDYIYLVSSYDGVIGPLVTGWLSLAIIGYFIYKKPWVKLHKVLL